MNRTTLDSINTSTAKVTFAPKNQQTPLEKISLPSNTQNTKTVKLQPLATLSRSFRSKSSGKRSRLIYVATCALVVHSMMSALISPKRLWGSRVG